ncbi:MAG: thioesterase family protein, partial [Acidiferrobacterales bacterium]
DIAQAPVIGIAAESLCRFRRELTFPQVVEAGLRVAHLGNSSVRYEIGLFTQDQEQAAATGYFVHVFVRRDTNKPVPMPPTIRQALERLRVGAY